MLPLAPAALLVTAAPTEAVPLDATPVFKRSDYCIVQVTAWTPEETCELGELGHLHEFYTVDCHTVAFPLDSWGAGGKILPVTDSAVPYAILDARALKACPTEDGDKWHPHTHPGLFRWID
jgi:hypothetical protein